MSTIIFGGKEKEPWLETQEAPCYTDFNEISVTGGCYLCLLN